MPPTTEWVLAVDLECRGRNGGYFACRRGYVGYKMTSERDKELVLCHSEHRRRTLPFIGKLIWIVTSRDNITAVLSSLGLSSPETWCSWLRAHFSHCFKLLVFRRHLHEPLVKTISSEVTS